MTANSSLSQVNSPSLIGSVNAVVLESASFRTRPLRIADTQEREIFYESIRIHRKRVWTFLLLALVSMVIAFIFFEQASDDVWGLTLGITLAIFCVLFSILATRSCIKVEKAKVGLQSVDFRPEPVNSRRRLGPDRADQDCRNIDMTLAHPDDLNEEHYSPSLDFVPTAPPYDDVVSMYDTTCIPNECAPDEPPPSYEETIRESVEVVDNTESRGESAFLSSSLCEQTIV